MKKFIMVLLRQWKKNPVKIALTIISLGLGTGVLILSLSASMMLENQVVSKLAENGSVVYAANGQLDSEGDIERNRPGEWDTRVTDILLSDSQSISAAAVIAPFPESEVNINNKTYQFRTMYGSEPEYFDVMDLEIIAGVEMTQKDYDKGYKKIWISQEIAESIFGSADAAIGEYVAPPGQNRQSGRRMQLFISKFKITGVYESPDEIKRRAYGIADAILPVSAFISGENAQRMLNFVSQQVVVKSSSTSIDSIEAEISSITRSAYGEDTDVIVWEGTASGDSSFMNDLRSTVSILTISLNILGVVLLVISALGIFSIMAVESLGRQKEIAIERSLGASKTVIVKEFFQWSLMMSTLAVGVGIILSIVVAEPVLSAMNPLIQELSGDINSTGAISIFAVLGASVVALGAGGVLGLLPSFAVIKGNISDTLREG